MKQWKNPIAWTVFLVFLLVVLFTRYYALAYAPPGSDGDTAWIALDAAALVDRGVIPHYVDPLHSPDPVIVYLIGITKIFLGATIYTPRVVTATASVLTALLMIPMMWELLPRASIRFRVMAGLFAMGAAATSLHAVNISRLGHDSPVLPVVVTLTVWMTAAAWHRGGWWRWILAGMFLASTQYVYLTGRMMGLVPPIWVLYTFLANRQHFKTRFAGWVVMGIVAFLLVLPNLILFVTLPESFSGRVDADSAGATGLIWETNVANNGQLLAFLGKKLWLMFRATGIEWIDPLLPMDTPIFTPLFFIGWMIGILVALRRVKHVGYGLLLIAMPVLLLGDLITSSELNPTPMRQTQVLPIYYALSGIGLAFVMDSVFQYIKGTPRYIIGGLVLIIAVVPPMQGFYYYINTFVPDVYADPETAWRISQTDIDISNRLVSQAEQSYLLPYSEYTRKTTAWLTLDGFPDRRSALTSDNMLTFENSPTELVIIQATDPDRARLDRSVGLNYMGWWVLLHDGQTLLLPPLNDAQQQQISNAIAETPTETIIDASGQSVASLYPFTVPDNFFIPPDFTPVEATIGRSAEQPEVRLIGYTTSAFDAQADAIYVSLYWQPLQRLTENYEVFVQLWDDNATVYAESHTLPYQATYRTRVWYPDEITVTHHVLFINSDLPPQRYTLATNFYRILQNERLFVSGADAGSNQDVVVLDDFRIVPEQNNLSLNTIEQTIQFSDYISVDNLELTVNNESVDIFGEWQASAGDTIALSMQLDVLERLPFDYSYFVHVTPVDEAQPIAQADSALGATTLPSGAWRAGDTWFEVVQLGLPENIEAGEYDVWLGIYYYADGSRLSVSVDDEMMPDDRLRLGQIIIE